MTPISPFKQTHARTHLCQHSSPPLSLPKALRHCERGCLPSSPRFMTSCLSDNIRLSEISSHEGAVKLVTSAYHVLLSSRKLSPTLQAGVRRFSDSTVFIVLSVHCASRTQQPYYVTAAQGTILATTVAWQSGSVKER